MLAGVTATLFPGISPREVGYKRQIGLKMIKGTVYLDYVLSANSPLFPGRKNVILEVQGGGETSNTGTLSNHINSWLGQPNPTNDFLRAPMNKVGIIPNNAWKRQLEQIFRKFPIARRFEGAFALAVGTILFDYITARIGEGLDWSPRWDIAIIELREIESNTPGAVPLEVGRVAFMQYEEFVNRVSEQEVPGNAANPFVGEFTTLTNSRFVV
jgi:hypothetical protein